MSMEVLKDAIRLVNADDGVKTATNVRISIKFSKAERNCQQLAAGAATSEYDPELDDIIVNSNGKRRNIMNQNKKQSAKNISLLEKCRLKRKTDLLKRNVKYMIYGTNCTLDPDKTKQMINFMDEHDRCRKKILRALRRRSNGMKDYRRKFKKSNNKSIFTDEDFMKIGPGSERIKLLRGKNVRKRDH